MAWSESPAVKAYREDREREFNKCNKEVRVKLTRKTKEGIKEVLNELKLSDVYYRFEGDFLVLKLPAAEAFFTFLAPVFNFITDLKEAIKEVKENE